MMPKNKMKNEVFIGLKIVWRSLKVKKDKKLWEWSI